MDFLFKYSTNMLEKSFSSTQEAKDYAGSLLKSFPACQKVEIWAPVSVAIPRYTIDHINYVASQNPENCKDVLKD